VLVSFRAPYYERGMRATTRWARLLLAACTPVAAALLACGTDAVGVDACKQVETARCRAAPVCHVPLEPPYTTNGNDIDACIRFYGVACLHGLVSGNAPSPTALAACVAAIGDHPCSPGGPNLVLAPEKDPACTWLLPAGAPADAGDAAATLDANVETGVTPEAGE
jgi:hypothetical protein